jgi:Lon protease-like protein
VLIQALMNLPESAPRRFGIIALRPGQGTDEHGDPQLHEVGCTTLLREVTPHPDGRYDIIAVGQDRFRLLEIDRTSTASYLTGVVELLPEPDGESDLYLLTAHASQLFNRYRQSLKIDLTELPDDPQVVSYLIAAAMVLELPRRQALLEQPTTSERLAAEIPLLRQERAFIEAFGTLPASELTLAEPDQS